MKIAFFTEGGYKGKPKTNEPMRTDQAWVYALNAYHWPIPYIMVKGCKERYDIGIVIIPKTTGGNTGASKNQFDRDNLTKQNYPLIETIKQICDKVFVMQESTHWDWQEDPAEIMIWYYNQLTEADGILCHNDIDVPYYKGITNKPAFIFPTLMIDEGIKNLEKTLEIKDHLQFNDDRYGDEIYTMYNNKFKTKQDRVFVAGNWHTTYRGFDAWVIGQEFDLPMYGFKSGKFKQNEELNGINYLPWMDWYRFMYELSQCKYGVQCYQASAGQFPLNCAYLGVPCIGYDDINTQKDLFPDLSVKRGDILHARRLANNLQKNKEFYNRVSIKAKELYNELYKEDKFLEKWNKIIKEL